jgi:hypothetical protein
MPWEGTGSGEIRCYLGLVELDLILYLSVFSAIFSAAAEFKGEYSPKLKYFNYYDFARRWARHAPYPCIMGFGLGVSICVSATIRNRDDIYNPYFAAIFCGILHKTISECFIRSEGVISLF